MGKLLL